MKFIFILFSILFVSKSFAQSKLEYGDFIQWNNKIEWAAETDQYIDLTPKIPKYSIKNWYLQRLRDSGIATYAINPNGYSVTKTFITKNNFSLLPGTDTISDDRIFGETELKYTLRNLDTTSLFYKNLTNCACSNCSHSSLIDIIKVKQLVYYKDAKFHITNVLLTPMCIRGEGTYSGDLTANRLFNVAFNNDSDIEPNKQMIFIGTIEKIYNFNPDITKFPEERKILTARNPYLMRLILRDWQKNKIIAYNPEKLIIETKGHFPITPQKFEIPVFDSLGEQIRTETREMEINIDSFYHFGITQDIYFDTVHEKLISKIKKVNIEQEIYTNAGIYLGKADCATIFYDKKKYSNYISPYIKAKQKPSAKKQRMNRN